MLLWKGEIMAEAISGNLVVKQQQKVETKKTADEKKEVENPIGKELSKTEEPKNEKSWFSKWLNDEDKVSTDGKDDGKIPFWDKAKSFGKGLMGVVKAVVNHPIATAAVVVGGIVVTGLTGGAALPIIVAAGAAVGAGQIGYGAYKASRAKTDGEAKAAWEGIGNGTFAVGTSALSAGAALNAASKAGVTGAFTSKNPVTNLVNCVKVAPKAIKQGGKNIKFDIQLAKAEHKFLKAAKQNVKAKKQVLKVIDKQLKLNAKQKKLIEQEQKLNLQEYAARVNSAEKDVEFSKCMIDLEKLQIKGCEQKMEQCHSDFTRLRDNINKKFGSKN